MTPKKPDPTGTKYPLLSRCVSPGVHVPLVWIHCIKSHILLSLRNCTTLYHYILLWWYIHSSCIRMQTQDQIINNKNGLSTTFCLDLLHIWRRSFLGRASVLPSRLQVMLGSVGAGLGAAGLCSLMHTPALIHVSTVHGRALCPIKTLHVTHLASTNRAFYVGCLCKHIFIKRSNVAVLIQTWMWDACGFALLVGLWCRSKKCTLLV